MNFVRTKQGTNPSSEFESREPVLCTCRERELGHSCPQGHSAFFLKDDGGKRKFNSTVLTLLGTLQNVQANHGKLHSNDFPNL